MVKRKPILIATLTLIVCLPFLLFKINSKFSTDNKARYQVVEGYISEGDVLGKVLLAQNISPAEVFSIIRELKKVLDVRRCNVGDRWEIFLDNEERFVKFIYYNGPINFYIVKFDRDKNTYPASAQKIETERKLKGVRGKIKSSLYESMSDVDVNPEIIIQFAEIFASKIDFFNDCGTGDDFTILWESYFDSRGNVLKDGRISAASYGAGDSTHYAFYFEPSEGKGGYYDAYGKNVESSFLRVPLNYRRISSYFTNRRFHPIHRVYRPHLGIDYAAPAGTPVSAIAEGTVKFAGWRRDGFGKTVILRHPNGYVSWYGHLSKTAKGIKRGARAKKGQVIGYVGTTGTSTGPHLDFRIQKNGKFVNFRTLKLPPSNPLADKYLPAFRETKDTFISKMESLKGAKPAIFPN
ncbi:MAG: M23 family metallopeptidase [Candidatus Ratteibacteria bacterium]|jgi:murein DD-endopeptidase MepM/ murein hydrolase activator NlpD